MTNLMMTMIPSIVSREELISVLQIFPVMKEHTVTPMVYVALVVEIIVTVHLANVTIAVVRSAHQKLSVQEVVARETLVKSVDQISIAQMDSSASTVIVPKSLPWN